MSRISRAPWQPDQLRSISEFQKSGVLQPFTCPDGGCRYTTDAPAKPMTATPDGLLCPDCRRLQLWVLTCMTDWSWRDDPAVAATLVMPAAPLTGDPAFMRAYTPRAVTASPAFTCPRCATVSFHPDDVRHGYCGACHDWTA